MGEIDQPHDAEDQAEAGGEQRIEPAEQHALDDAYRASSWLVVLRNRRRGCRRGRGRRARPTSVMRPSIMQ